MVVLVEDSITGEELCGEPSHKLLIIDRYPLRVLLGFEMPFHFVEPRFVCYLFSIDLIAISWFIQPLNSDPRSLISHLTLNIDDMVASASAN